MSTFDTEFGDEKPAPGRPPKKYQWKKGCPSPNPKGRPRKEQQVAPDLRKIMETALSKKLRITKGEKSLLLSRAEMMIEQLLNQAAKGDRDARRDVLNFSSMLGIDLTGQAQRVNDALAPTHQEILDAYLSRQNSSVDKGKPVIAPDDLLDDN